MNSKTHRQGGYSTTLILYPLLLNMMTNLKFTSTSNKILIYALTLLLMFTGARYGTLYPDLDQNKSVLPLKNIFTYAINKVIYALGASHRSFHTHSMDVSLLLFGTPTYILYKNITKTTLNESQITFLAFAFMISFTLAVLIHIFLDLYTIGGVHISALLSYVLYKFKKKYVRRTKYNDFKITLAPKNIRYIGIITEDSGKKHIGLKQPFNGNFRTGSAYEEAIRSWLFVLNIIGFIISVALIIKGAI